VQKAFEEEDQEKNEFNILIAKTFRMKSLSANQSMTPILPSQLIASSASIPEARVQLCVNCVPFLLVYHREVQNIVAIAYLRDLLSFDSKKKILDLAKPPWFVGQDVSLLQILEQFRRNNQSVSVILDASGQASGVLTLDQIVDLIFGSESPAVAEEEGEWLYIERTLLGSMSVEQFNREFSADLPGLPQDTLSDLLVSEFGHAPSKDESVEIGSYKFTVIEPTLRGVKLISVKTAE
jgi:CBS domain containing-hemolysin-like protein